MTNIGREKFPHFNIWLQIHLKQLHSLGKPYFKHK